MTSYQSVLPLDGETVAAHMEEQHTVLLAEGIRVLSNSDRPRDDAPLFAWLTSVADAGPEQRWALLELLAGTALALINAGGPPAGQMTDPDRETFLTKFGPDPLVIAGADDALTFIESGANPIDELPDAWLPYLTCATTQFVSACAVFAFMAFEAVRETAHQDTVPAVSVWRHAFEMDR